MPDITKRHCLFAALKQPQSADGCANGVLAFVTCVTNPVQHIGRKEYFERVAGPDARMGRARGRPLGDVEQNARVLCRDQQQCSRRAGGRATSLFPLL